MEEEQSQPASPSPQVGFPDQQKEESKRGFPKWIFALLGVIIIVAVGGFFIFRLSSQENSPQATPSGQSLGAVSTPSPSPTVEPTENPEPVDKSEIAIEVLNGTGIAGGASFLSNELEDLGYENIEAGNADSQDEELTTVTFTRDVQTSVIEELTAKLEELYSEVRTRRGTISGDFDIRIVTGPRKDDAEKEDNTPTNTPDPTEEPEE